MIGPRITVFSIALGVAMLTTSATFASTDADEFLADALQRYAGVGSYQDQMRVAYDVAFADPAAAAAMGPAPEDALTDLAFARPNLMALRSEMMSYVTDGTTCVATLPELGQFVEMPAPAVVDPVAPFAALGTSVLMTHPVAVMLGAENDDSFASLFPEMTDWTIVGQSPSTTHLRGRFDTSQLMPESVPGTADLVFDGDGFLQELSIDLTDSYRDMASKYAGMPVPERMALRFTIENRSVDGTIAAGQFQPAPGEGLTKVAAFSLDQPAGGDQDALVGAPAPDFTGVNLRGESITLSDLRGKVVLMDFWATWCGPCVRSIPDIQKLAEHFEGQDVVILGINNDQPDKIDQVRRFVADKGLTFPHLVGSGREISAAYRVSGIPCTVVIDARGVVHEIHVGSTPGHADHLRQTITDLLRAGA